MLCVLTFLLFLFFLVYSCYYHGGGIFRNEMSGTVVFNDGNEPRYGGYATGGDYAITGSVDKTDSLGAG